MRSSGPAFGIGRAVTVALTLAIAAIALPAAATAGQRERTFRPTPGVVTAPPPGAVMKDRVLGEEPKALKRATASATENAYATPSGAVVYIAVSESYAPDPAADQSFANFLDSLLHDFELSELYVYIAAPEEMAPICGDDAAACYFPDTQQMVVVGESSFGGLPTDYVTAHEYGHHIENYRLNPPWSALDFGTKRWASYEGICPGTLSGRYTPPDSISFYDYYRDPGEAFAEAYAYANFPNLVAWEWVGSLLPDAGAYSAIRADVMQPWTGPTRFVRRGRVARRGDRFDNVRIRAPLDGTLALDLKGPRRADLDLFLFRAGHGHILKKSVHRGSREGIHFIVCGGYKFDAVVSAFRGAGHYRLRVKRP